MIPFVVEYNFMLILDVRKTQKAVFLSLPFLLILLLAFVGQYVLRLPVKALVYFAPKYIRLVKAGVKCGLLLNASIRESFKDSKIAN